MLVLRSRPAAYRAPGLSGLGGSFAGRDEPGLAELIRARDRVYNRQAAELQSGDAQIRGGADLLQIAVPDHTRVIRRLENNGERITEALRYGAQAMASMILREAIDLCWQPVVYRADAVERLARLAGRPASREDDATE